MLHSLKELQKRKLEAEDGDLGKISDYIFHDHDWAVRYLVVTVDDDGGKEVLVSPRVVTEFDTNTDSPILLSADRERILNGPEYRKDIPLSRQFETKFHDYYDLPYYWIEEGTIPTTGPGDLTGVPLVEMELDREEQEDEMFEPDERVEESLRRFSDVEGFPLQGREGQSAGKLDDFIINDENWAIMYAVVDVGGILPGKKVLVSPSLMNFADWANNKILLDITDETIKESPEFQLDMLNSDEFSMND